MSTSVISDGDLRVRPHLPLELVERIMRTGTLDVFHIDDVDEDGSMTHEEYVRFLEENPRGPDCPEDDYSPVLLADAVRDVGEGEMSYELARKERMLRNLIRLLKQFLVRGGFRLDGACWYIPDDFREMYSFEVRGNRIAGAWFQSFDYRKARRRAVAEGLGEVDRDSLYSRYGDEQGMYGRRKRFGQPLLKAYNTWLGERRACGMPRGCAEGFGKKEIVK